MNRKFWFNYNPNITVDVTTKKYFGEYLYKIVVYAPGGRLIDSKHPIQEALNHRMALQNHIANYSYWLNRQDRDLSKADILLLEKIKYLKHNKLIKLRIEEPRIQIYAKTSTELENLVIDHLQDFPHNYIESISGPADKQAENVLNSGAIIRKTDNGYKYKVIVRDGRYGKEIKSHILNYLGNLDKEQIQLSNAGRDILNSKSNYIWNLSFYCNDLSICTFLDLISPGLILNHHEIVVHK